MGDGMPGQRADCSVDGGKMGAATPHYDFARVKYILPTWNVMFGSSAGEPRSRGFAIAERAPGRLGGGHAGLAEWLGT